MQAMGHIDPNMFRRHYLNQIISTDTLACFLRMPSREGLMRLAGQMSLTQDADAPTSLSEKQKQDILADPALQAARASCDLARSQLLTNCKRLKDAREADPKGMKGYVKLQNAAKALHNRLQSDKLKSLRAEFFATAGARYIEEQCQDGRVSPSGSALTPLSHSRVFDIEERNLLPSIIFGPPESKQPAGNDDHARLAEVVRVLASLCRRCSRPSGRADTVYEPLSEEEMRHDEQTVDTFPILVPGTVCLFCLGDSSLPSHARTYAYARRSSLARHVERLHLRHVHAPFLCPHPYCTEQGTKMQDGMHFKNHAATTHNVVH